MSEQEHGSDEVESRGARVEALLHSIEEKLEEISKRQLQTDDFVWGSRDKPDAPSLVSRLKEVETKIESAQRTVRWFAGPSLVTLLATLVIGYKLLGKVSSDGELTRQLMEAVEKRDHPEK